MSMKRSKSTEQKLGSLIAVEGDCQVISTQLRLLPPSSKVLILPPLIDDVRERSEDNQFNARTFVRDVHSAFVSRTETARSFLVSSTNEQPRLVFMNGGSVCAKTTCITNICENITHGNIREAETLFGDIVKDGVVGLMRPDTPVNERVEEEEKVYEDGASQEGKRSISDAGSVAMKAADDLDRDTADLQPSVEDLIEDDAAGEVASGPVVTSVEPAASEKEDEEETDTAGKPLSQGEATHGSKSQDDIPAIGQGVFTTPQGVAIRQTIISLPDRQQIAFSKGRNSATTLHPGSELDSDDVLSPSVDLQHSQPATPTAAVVYGEACIVDVQSASLDKKFRRVRSVDGLFGRGDRLEAISPTALRRATSSQELTKTRTRGAETHLKHGSNDSFDFLPRTSFVKASATTIKRSPTLNKASLSSTKVYVDRGSDVIDERDSVHAETFEPVFPVVEDLVLYFSNTNNEIFEAVIRAYKDESYPVYPFQESQSTPVATATRPSTSNDSQADDARPFSNITSETDDDGYQRRQEVDPYNPDSYPSGQRLWPRQSKTLMHTSSANEPLTPATTPPPTFTTVGQKFHEFSPINSNSAVGVQNSLRAVLKLHYGPAETTKYRQYEAPLPCDRFWKPIFRDDDGQGTEGRTVDQILAIGSEDGVSAEFLSEISGQIEKLGTKRSGQSRVGKLDIRYLIATAMQSHTSTPLTAQSSSNPFGSPVTLATALVPHLETYLSMNTTRFLILQYPAQHLPTILCLRKLLGSDVLKVSGIIDALGGSDPPSFSGRSKTPPPALNLLSNEGAASLNTRHKPAMSIGSFARTRAELARQVSAVHSYSISNSSSKRDSSQMDPSYSFAKANFLLPSTATDAEIATFLSSIWKILIDKSNWYSPEPEVAPPVVISPPAVAKPVVEPTVRQPPPIPPTPANETAEQAPLSPMVTSHRQKKSIGGRSKIDQLLGNSASSRTNTISSVDRLAPSAGAPSITGSERERRVDKEWENFYLGPDGESDDEYERRLMPKVPIRTERKKGNSKKALKWLGLA